MFLKNSVFLPGRGWLLVKPPESEADTGEVYTVDVIELAAEEKSACPQFQEETAIRGAGGAPMMTVDIVLPKRCYVGDRWSVLKDRDAVREVPDLDGALLKTEEVIGWEWEDDRLKPPPGVVEDLDS